MCACPISMEAPLSESWVEVGAWGHLKGPIYRLIRSNPAVATLVHEFLPGAHSIGLDSVRRAASSGVNAIEYKDFARARAMGSWLRRLTA